MQKRFLSKLSSMCLLFVCVFLFNAVITPAQQNPGQKESGQSNEKNSETVKNADVSITANVTAKELRFESVPNPKVEFSGKKERQTLWESERQNLPNTVEPGVTYRNIGIQLRIASRFVDIERIVAEALGEIPVNDDQTTADKTTTQQKQAESLPLSSAAANESKKAAPAAQLLNRSNRP